MAKQLYREKSLDRISSPEQLNDYLKVTKPAVWIVLIAVIFLIAGFIVWCAFTYIGSLVEGTAEVKNGKTIVHFEDSKFVENVTEGMELTVGNAKGTILSIGYDQNGSIIAKADIELEDGTYDATVNYKKTQILGLLFGN